MLNPAKITKEANALLASPVSAKRALKVLKNKYGVSRKSLLSNLPSDVRQKLLATRVGRNRDVRTSIVDIEQLRLQYDNKRKKINYRLGSLGLFLTASKAFWYIGYNLHGPIFRQSVNPSIANNTEITSPFYRADGYNLWHGAYVSAKEKYLPANPYLKTGPDNYYMDITDKHVITKVALGNISFNYPLIYPGMPEDKRAFAQRAQAAVKALLPGFQAPTQIKVDPDTYNTVPIMPDDIIENTIPLTKFPQLINNLPSIASEFEMMGAGSQSRPSGKRGESRREASDWSDKQKFTFPNEYYANPKEPGTGPATQILGDIRLICNPITKYVYFNPYARPNVPSSVKGGESVNIDKLDISRHSGIALTVTIAVEFIVKWPKNYAYYVTDSHKESDFVPFNFWQYVNATRKIAATGTGTKTANRIFSQIKNFGLIKKSVDSYLAKARIKPKLRVNDDGFMLLGVGANERIGDVVWVPKDGADNVNTYMDMIKSSYNPKEKLFVLPDSKDIANRPLYIDIVNEKYSFVRKEGLSISGQKLDGITTINLNGSQALSDIQIANDLQEPISKLLADAAIPSALNGEFVNFLYKYAEDKLKLTKKQPWFTYKHIRKTYLGLLPQSAHSIEFTNTVFERFFSQMSIDGPDNIGGNIKTRGLADLVWQYVANSDFTVAEFAGFGLEAHYDLDENGFPLNKSAADATARWVLIDYIKRCVAEIVSNPNIQNVDLEEGEDAFPVSSRIMGFQYFLFLLGKYAPKHKEYTKLADNTKKVCDNEVIQNTDPNKLHDIAKQINIVNLPGLKKHGLPPHQVKAVYSLSNTPGGALESIGTGGGKSITTLIDVMKLMYDKKIIRAFIVVPSNRLVGNWVSEIVKFSNGSINAVGLTTQSFDQMIKDLTQGRQDIDEFEAFEKAILSMPPNTIFVATSRFFMARSQQILYNTDEVVRYPVAERLRDIGVDGLFIDESHDLKTVNTNKAQAVAVLATDAKIIRLMSGTVINDRPLDIVGQLGITSPGIFRSPNDFIANYTVGEDIKNVRNQAVYDRIRQFIKQVTHLRQDWAHLLPIPHEEFYIVQLTDTQKLYYDLLIGKAIEMMDDDEEYNIDENDEVSDGTTGTKKRKAKKDTDNYDENDDFDDEEDEKRVKKGNTTALLENIHFQRIETFLYSPDAKDANGDWIFDDFIDGSATGVKPTQEDLISPKLKSIARIITNHFGAKDGPTPVTAFEATPQFKVMIFCSRRLTPPHIMRHITKYVPSSLRDAFIEYQAGDNDSLNKFLDPGSKYKILVAMEKSINTGLNFQLSNRIIRVETLWTPGDQEQAFARIWRPSYDPRYDVKARPDVYFDRVYTANTLEVMKIAKVIAKNIQKIKVDRVSNPSFRTTPFKMPVLPNAENGRENPLNKYLASAQEGNRSVMDVLNDDFADLVEPKINKSNMQFYQTDSGNEALMKFIAANALITAWEEKEYFRSRKHTQVPLYKLDDSQFLLLPGSKRMAYSVRTPSVDPSAFDPDNRFGYKSLAVVNISDDDDDNENNIVDNTSIEVTYYRRVRNAAGKIKEIPGGTIVNTPYGFGRLLEPTGKQKVVTPVQIIGAPNNEPIVINKSMVWVVTNEEAISILSKKMAEAAKNKTSMYIKPFGGQIYVDPLGDKFLGSAKELDVAKTPTTKPQAAETKAPVAAPPSNKTSINVKPPVGKPPAAKPTQQTKPPVTITPFQDGDEIDISKDMEVELDVSIINGTPALIGYIDDPDFDVVAEKIGGQFEKSRRFHLVHVKKLDVLIKLLYALNDEKQKITVPGMGKFVFNSDSIGFLGKLVRSLKNNNITDFKQLNQFDSNQYKVDNLFITGKRLNIEADEWPIYPLVKDNNLYLVCLDSPGNKEAFNYFPAFIRNFIANAGVGGNVKFIPANQMARVRFFFFKRPSEIAKFLNKMLDSTGISISDENFDEIETKLKEMRQIYKAAQE